MADIILTTEDFVDLKAGRSFNTAASDGSEHVLDGSAFSPAEVAVLEAGGVVTDTFAGIECSIRTDHAGSELGTITVTCDDGDSWPTVLSSLDDFLVEVETRDATLLSGYVTTNRDGLRLRPTFTPSSRLGPTQVNWDYIKRIRVL